MSNSRLPKNCNHICEQCSEKFYRRGTKQPKYCSNPCKYASYHKQSPKEAGPEPSGLVDATTAGNIVGFSPGYVRRLGAKGKIPRTPWGRFVRFNVNDLQEYARACGY